MRKSVLVCVLLSMLSGEPGAEVTLETRDGKVFSWFSYFEDEDHYCTVKTVGKFCIPKRDVVAIKKVEKKKAVEREGYGYSKPDVQRKDGEGEEGLEQERETLAVKAAEQAEDAQKDTQEPDGRKTLKQKEDEFRKALQEEREIRYYPRKYYER